MTFKDSGEQKEIDPYLMLSEADKEHINAVFEQILQPVGRKPLENVPVETQNKNAVLLDELFEKYSPEAVIDHLIYAGNNDVYQEESCEPPFCEPHNQYQHSDEIADAEMDPSDTTETHSFGLFAPGYKQAIEDRVPEMQSNQDLHAMLFGSYGKTSAEEFDKFMKQVNPDSTNTVVDLSIYGLQEVDPNIQRINSDVTELGVASNSQDIIFTNFLIPFLYKGSGPLPKAKNIIAMAEEANRVLKEGGQFVMREGPFDFERDTPGAIRTLTLYTILKVLERAGFGKRDVMYAQKYLTHADKVAENEDAVAENKIYHGLEEGGPDLNSIYRYDYIIRAEKGPETHHNQGEA